MNDTSSQCGEQQDSPGIYYYFERDNLLGEILNIKTDVHPAHRRAEYYWRLVLRLQ